MTIFSSMTERDRSLFIARLHHAMWHDEQTFRSIQNSVIQAEFKIPKAEYFPKQDNYDATRKNPIGTGLLN
jgi:hypothetical protein